MCEASQFFSDLQGGYSLLTVVPARPRPPMKRILKLAAFVVYVAASSAAVADAAEKANTVALPLLQPGKRLVLSGTTEHSYADEAARRGEPPAERFFSLTVRHDCLWSMVSTTHVHIPNAPPLSIVE